MNRLLQILEGRTISIVGNGNVRTNVSSEIDAADVVVRFNNFYNYDSHNVGRRVDLVMQTITDRWFNTLEKHIDVIRTQRPEIFIVKRPDTYNTKVHDVYGDGIRVNKMLAREFAPWYRFTTGTCVLAYLAQNLKNASVRCYGFQDDDDWERYITSDARQYAGGKKDERQVMMESIKKLESLSITKPHVEIPRVIVVPIKRNSEGAQGKNKILIRPCINEILLCKYPIYIVGDDCELLRELKSEYGDLINTHLTHPIQRNADVTETLRLWSLESGYCGDVALVQCTSPHLRHEWVHKCFDSLSRSPISATACDVGFKPTALFTLEGNVFVPYSSTMPPASVARQKLPLTIRITGAVEAFHTDCLAFPSFFMAGTLEPVMISKTEALDVDTKEDLQKAIDLINMGK